MNLETDKHALDSNIRIAVVEDHKTYRKGLVQLLNQQEEIEVVLEAENGKDFLAQLESHDVDVVLLDLSMPVMDGWETLKILHQEYPSLRKIILSSFSDLPIQDLIELGVNGYLLKKSELSKIMDAIFAAKYDGFFGRKKATMSRTTLLKEKSASDDQTDKFLLNFRQMQILTMICDGKKSNEIAQFVSLSKSSIDAIRSEALKAFNARNTTELLRKCILHQVYIPRTDEDIKVEEYQLLLQRDERRKLRRS